MITIVKVENEKYLESMVQFQLTMAKESEDLVLDKVLLTKGIKSVIQNKNLGEYFVALKDGIAVGMLLTIPEWSDWRCRTVIWIHSVYVSSEHRGEGIYKKLYQHIKKTVDTHDEYAGIRLYVDKKNLNAIKVYEKLGMSNEHYELYEYLKNS